MSKVQATEGLTNHCAILEQRPVLKHDADIVCRLCVSVALATCFCAAGRTFDDITQKASTHGLLFADRDIFLDTAACTRITTQLFCLQCGQQMSS